jgi:glycine cleavage system H protein
VYSPLSGEITEGNKSIVDSPESVNSDPEGASWFFKIKIKDKSELDLLMSKTEYDKFIAENPS